MAVILLYKSVNKLYLKCVDIWFLYYIIILFTNNTYKTREIIYDCALILNVQILIRAILNIKKSIIYLLLYANIEF